MCSPSFDSSDFYLNCPLPSRPSVRPPGHLVFQAEGPVAVDALLTRVFSLATHPDKNRRLGGLMAFNQLCRPLREETSLLDRCDDDCGHGFCECFCFAQWLLAGLALPVCRPAARARLVPFWGFVAAADGRSPPELDPVARSR